VITYTWSTSAVSSTISVSGRVGYPFFGQLILDCIEGTERSMSQEHAFRAAELCLQAQAAAVRIEG
jgi:hypothetical protein